MDRTSGLLIGKRIPSVSQKREQLFPIRYLAQLSGRQNSQ
jgi:hypothetical protein